MKVLCIHDCRGGGNGCIEDPTDESPLIIGNVYTVVRQRKRYGVLCYSLEEIPPTDGIERAFDADCFAPISRIDEVELSEQRKHTHESS